MLQEAKLDISELPQPPVAAVFSLVKVDKVSIPHPYCIGTQHVAWAADHFSGKLGKEAIEDAEKRGGASCDICRTSGHGILPFSQHESSFTLFIRVPQNKDLNAVEGLHAYLYTNKATFESFGIQGFAFPK